MSWQAKANTPLSVTALLSLPESMDVERKVRVYPMQSGQQLATDPSKTGSCKPLVLKNFFLGGENTLGLVSCTLTHTSEYACTLYIPNVPLPNNSQENKHSKMEAQIPPQIRALWL